MLQSLQKYCMTLPGATENVQWGKDLVFKVGGKMFCCMGTEPDSKFSFKVEDYRFLELTDQPGVVPAPYLARAKWIQIDPAETDLKLAQIKPLVKRSHALVFAKLTKKAQREIAEAS